MEAFSSSISINKDYKLAERKLVSIITRDYKGGLKKKLSIHLLSFPTIVRCIHCIVLNQYQHGLNHFPTCQEFKFFIKRQNIKQGVTI